MNTYYCDIVIFGGYGDLSFRKLIPSLYYLIEDDYVDKNSRIVVVSREPTTSQKHLTLIKKKLQLFIDDFSENTFLKLAPLLHYCCVDFTQPDTFKNLHTVLSSEQGNRIFYLSTASTFYSIICEQLFNEKLITPLSRVVVEKPIGKDLASSKSINHQVLKFFKEEQIYRIDHYLGKETVQNLLALRFSNTIFSLLWEANHIEHIQISVSESIGVEGRWGYYDDYGAMRDMVQNHILQLVCLIAMEPPFANEPNAIRDEKLKVLNSLRIMEDKDIENDTIRAQYTAGMIDGKQVDGYLDEGDNASTTETFVALKLFIDNWRWRDVPFYIRSGKRMAKKNAEIVISFKPVAHNIFNSFHKANQLVISLQPNESIKLNLMNKKSGIDEQMKLQDVKLELGVSENKKRKYDAYERLFLDVIRSNPTLFMRLDEVESAWKWSDKIINAWKNNIAPLQHYTAGTNGPISAETLLAKDNRSWYE